MRQFLRDPWMAKCMNLIFCPEFTWSCNAPRVRSHSTLFGPHGGMGGRQVDEA